VAVALQQLLAQPLPLQELEFRLECELPALNLFNLSKLQQLRTSRCHVHGDSVLPATLQQLEFYASSRANNLAPVTGPQLKHLQHVTLRVDSEQLQPLLQLAQLPALQHLSLQYTSYTGGAAAAATAAAWLLLPQLRELIMRVSLPLCDLDRILAGVSAATSLTKLELKVACEEGFQPVHVAHDTGARAAPFACMARLTNLKDLCCSFCVCGININGCYQDALQLAAGDAQALTALTNLTSLDLACAWDGVGAVAATALASNLKQLQHLCLCSCNLKPSTAEGLACLAAIGSLTQLTYLNLGLCDTGNGVTQQGLMQLAGLSRLQHFACENFQWSPPWIVYERYTRYVHTGANGVMQRFWAALRAKDQQL
jgi:hypothetical protein